MRRLLYSLTALGLLGAAIGCHKTTGVCDCELGHNPFGPAYSVHDFGPAPVAADLPVGGHYHANATNEPPLEAQAVGFSE